MKKYTIVAKAVIISLILGILIPIDSHAATYDYVNDNTGLVYPDYADISDNYKKGDFAVCSGENLMFSGTECMFYKTNLTEKTLMNSTGYEYSDPVHIKDKLGVPINVRLTWGMVAAYEKATNTVYVSDEMEKAYHTITIDDFMAVLGNDAAFYELQHKYRLETIALVKSLVAQRKNTATNVSVDSLKNASVNNADFNAYIYYSNYPDLQAAIGADAKALYSHWQQYGKAEGRKAK
jgi:hypothetical protein